MRPGLLSIMMQNPNIASTLFDASGQIEQSVKAGQKKEAMKNVMSQMLEDLKVNKKDLEKLDWDDYQLLIPLILPSILKKLTPTITTEVGAQK